LGAEKKGRAAEPASAEEAGLRILVIDVDPARAAVLEQGLVETGYANVMTIRASANLLERVQAIAPDVIIIDLENPDRDMLDSAFQVSREVRRPIAMFVDQSDSSMIRQAVEAGVSAYVVDGLRKERVRPIVDMAISRFAALDQLTRERDEARSALAERKLIDRAKGLLMDKRGMSEEEASKAIRTAAMQQNRKMVEIAESVITAFQMQL
jgi:response regulator NasT